MITRTQIPASEYTEDIVEKNGIFYKYLCPAEIAEGILRVYEMSFMSRPTTKVINQEKAANIPLYKGVTIDAIVAYDKSDAVNEFLVNGQHCWLDKFERVSLVNSVQSAKDSGEASYILYLNGVAFDIPVDTALGLLQQIELYATSCYRKTEEHKAAVNNFSVLEDILNYDITAGYPEKLSFTLNV